MQGEEEIYASSIHPKDEEVLDRLTSSRNWDYGQFRNVLIALGTLRKGNSIPGRNRPDSIHIQGWRKHIDELAEMTKKNGKEHARAIFVDSDRQSLVVSGKTTVGTESSVRLDMTKQPRKR